MMLSSSSYTTLLVVLLLSLLVCASIQAEPDTTINWQTCAEQTPSRRSASLLSQWTKQVWHQLKKKWNSNAEREEMIQELVRRHHEHHKRMSMSTAPQTMFEYNNKRGLNSQQASYVVECALINVPLVWNDDAESRTIEFFVKRWRIPGRQPTGQLWLLQGGPGSPGSVFDGVGAAYQTYLDGKYDIYAPDHRGTGRSSYLSCPVGSMESTDANVIQLCVNGLKSQYGSKALLGFGTTNAANDVMYVANLIKQTVSEKVAIYGVSYGTYWLNRILTLFPNQVDTTIFDSVVQPTMTFTDRDDQFNEAGERFIQVCKASTDCNGRFKNAFNADVETVMASVFKKQAGNNGCQSDIYSPSNLSRFFAIVSADTDYRRLVFPIIFRLNRCGTQDQQWLQNVGEVLYQSVGSDAAAAARSTSSINDPAYSSQEVFLNIVTSELTTYPLEHSANYWINRFSQYPPYFWAVFSSSVTLQAQAMQNNRYQEPLANTYADLTKHTKPVLTMQGTLDPQTPYSFAEDWNKHYNKDNNYFVQFPNAVHGTIFTTPTSTDTRFVDNLCGSVVLLEFVRDNSKVYRTCVSKTLDYSFNFDSLPTTVSQITLGLPLWDDSESGNAATHSPSLVFVLLIAFMTQSLFVLL